MSRYAQLEEKRQAERKRNQRRKLLKALRNGDYDRSTTTHTVHMRDKALVVSEVEYLWLFVRGHLQNRARGTTVDPLDPIHIHEEENFDESA